MQTGSSLIVEETRQAIQAVRGGLIELYGAAGADTAAPQEVARRYKIHRNLTWRLSRAITATDPFASLNHLPSQQGIELVIGGFEAAGVSREAVERVRTAIRRFTEVVRIHAGNRDQLELILESMGLLQRETTATTGRELAFRGNSSVWGVQARVRVAVSFVAPSALGPDKLDLVGLSGLVGFRRLRPDVEWSLARQRLWDDEGTLLDGQADLQPRAEGQLSQVLYEFCSPNMPALTFVDNGGPREVVLPPGDVGNSGVFDCYFATRYAGVPANCSPENEFGSVGCDAPLPVETAVCDLIFHESLALDKTVDAGLYGFPMGKPAWPWKRAARQLQMTERPVELAGSPPALTTPLVPAITRIAERVYSRMGWNPKEFRGLRLQVPYAPMGSELVMKWPLPDKGS
jgi:hypothetical protein